jgi:hypothetical protein
MDNLVEAGFGDVLVAVVVVGVCRGDNGVE